MNKQTAFKIKDPISALTHFIGAVFSLVAVVSLVMKAYTLEKPIYMVAFGIFGMSLVLLYSASTIYHIIEKPASLSKLLKRIDHMMIFVLIAGTYTPVCLIPLKGTVGMVLLTTVWCVAITGIILKIVWLNAPRWLSTLQYIMMGWIVVFAFFPLVRAVPGQGLAWLVAGGLIYTIGGVVYGTKWPPFKSKYFGFHELFHVFVMMGSLCHFIFIYQYI